MGMYPKLRRQIVLCLVALFTVATSGCAISPSGVCHSLERDSSWQRLESPPEDARSFLREVSMRARPRSLVWYRNIDGRLAACSPGDDDTNCDDSVTSFDESGEFIELTITNCCTYEDIFGHD